MQEILKPVRWFKSILSSFHWFIHSLSDCITYLGSKHSPPTFCDLCNRRIGQTGGNVLPLAGVFTNGPLKPISDSVRDSGTSNEPETAQNGKVCVWQILIIFWPLGVSLDSGFKPPSGACYYHLAETEVLLKRIRVHNSCCQHVPSLSGRCNFSTGKKRFAFLLT